MSLAQESQARLAEVVALAAAQGAFKVVGRPPTDPSEPWRFVQVETPAGLVFDLSAGTWNKEGQITAKVAYVSRGPFKIGPSDVRGGTLSASAGYKRSPEAILKDLTRRVFEEPEALKQATAIQTELARRAAMRGRLLAHVETLKAQGYEFHRMGDAEYCCAEGWKRGSCGPLSLVKVYETGRVTFEGSCDVSRFAEVAALLAVTSPK